MTLTRALIKSVKLPDRVAQTASRFSTGFAGGMAAASAQSGMDAYRSVGAVYGPVRRICDAVALTDWALYEQSTTRGDTDRELLDDATAPAHHPATALWTRPNPFMTRRQFLDIAQTWQETAGGVYWMLCNSSADGDPFMRKGVVADYELWPIRPDRIVAIPSPDGGVAGYVYTVGTERVPLPVQSIIPLGPKDPLDWMRFAGPLQALGTDVEAERLAAQYNRNVFYNNAEPGGVIEFEQALSQDRFEELVTRWREQHQGVNNAKRVAIIEGGSWKSVGQNNREMEYTKLRAFNRESVMYALGMPFAMMVTQDVNLANAQVGEKIFYRWTVRPRLEAIKEALNERVLPYFGENLTMDYELPSPEDEAFDVFAGMSGWIGGTLTQNEAREAMGYDSIGTEGDRYSWEITGTAPQIPPATPPKKPTTLSYRKAHPAAAEHERQMTGTWADRLAQIRTQYEDLLKRRN